MEDEDIGSTPLLPKGWSRGAAKFVSLVRAAIAEGGVVHVGNIRHSAIALALRELCYDNTLRNRSVRFRFRDGSTSQPFTFGKLATQSHGPAEPLEVLRVALMSYRHPEMDFFVDLYAFRNRELALERTAADEEEMAFSRAQEILSPLGESENLRVEVFHTGLEAMVIGFYRAVSELLATRQGRTSRSNLVFATRLYVDLGETTSEFFTPDSPGARPENYMTVAVWF